MRQAIGDKQEHRPGAGSRREGCERVKGAKGVRLGRLSASSSGLFANGILSGARHVPLPAIDNSSYPQSGYPNKRPNTSHHRWRKPPQFRPGSKPTTALSEGDSHRLTLIQIRNNQSLATNSKGTEEPLHDASCRYAGYPRRAPCTNNTSWLLLPRRVPFLSHLDPSAVSDMISK